MSSVITLEYLRVNELSSRTGDQFPSPGANRSPPIGNSPFAFVGDNKFPTDLACFVALTVFAICYPLVLDRYGMIDNSNYLQYFQEATAESWRQLIEVITSPLEAVTQLFTEEILWRVWVTVVGYFVRPMAGVYLTVSAINLLLAFAFVRFRYRTLAMLLWLVLPFGFAVIGTYQIRQGLAFAIWLYVGLRHRRLMLATVLAALVHTTFLVAVPLVAVASLPRCSAMIRILLSAVFSVGAALTGQTLFEQFGGRRIAVYADENFELSYNFLLMLLLFLTFPLLTIWSKGRTSTIAPIDAQTFERYVISYIGLVLFLLVCFFLFPLGDARLPYVAVLGLIPLLANAKYFNDTQPVGLSADTVLVASPVYLFLAYLCVKAAFEGRYACVFVANCSAVSIG